MKIVYIAGAFRGETPWEQVQNIRAAEYAALGVWQAGAVAVCPHLNSANFQGALPDAVWLEGYIELLRRCDAVLMVGEWWDSKGARAEMKEAKARGIPVFEVASALRKWLDE